VHRDNRVYLDNRVDLDKAGPDKAELDKADPGKEDLAKDQEDRANPNSSVSRVLPEHRVNRGYPDSKVDLD
jgi:hypothetical protein